MAEYLDNPAGRALALFQKARTFTANRNTNFQVWAGVFDIELKDKDAEFELLHRLYEAFELLNTLADEIERIEDQDEREEFLVPMGRLRNAILIAHSANTNIDNTIRQITDGDLIILKFCSRYLHNHRPEPVADATELEGLTNQLNNLFNSVESSGNLQPELKKFILSQIEAIRRGIQEYRIGGIERLRETLGSIYGAAFVNTDTIQGGKDTDEVRKFGEIVNTLASIVTFAWKTTKALEAAKAFLPMLLNSHTT